MEDFLTKKINGEEFCDQVYGLRRKFINTCEKFKLELISSSEKIQDFQPNGKAKKLSGFLTGLFCYCDDFMEEYENDQFSNAMQNGFLNFQKALNEE
jgi:hypothetical protein